MTTTRRPSPPRDSVTTTVEFDRATYKRLKLLAVERDATVRDLIREAVARLLGSHQPRGRS